MSRAASRVDFDPGAYQGIGFPIIRTLEAIATAVTAGSTTNLDRAQMPVSGSPAEGRKNFIEVLNEAILSVVIPAVGTGLHNTDSFPFILNKIDVAGNVIPIATFDVGINGTGTNGTSSLPALIDIDLRDPATGRGVGMKATETVRLDTGAAPANGTITTWPGVRVELHGSAFGYRG